MFYDPSKPVLQMVQMFVNAYECRCESNECVANERRTHNMGNFFCIIHIACDSHCLISARPCPISLFSFKIVLIVHILIM